MTIKKVMCGGKEMQDKKTEFVIKIWFSCKPSKAVTLRQEIFDLFYENGISCVIRLES